MLKPATLKAIHRSEHATLYETDNFKDGLYFIEKYRKNLKKILVLLDLDNTVLSYRHTLGTDQWFDFDYNEFIKQGITPQKAKETTLQYYLDLVKKIDSEDVYAVEEDTPEQVRKLQAKGVNTLLLTSRGDYLLDKTKEQLSQFELSFNHGKYANIKRKLPQSNEGLFTNGMILTGGAHKGDCLFSALQNCEPLPELMMMWDDKLSNLEKVRDAIKKYNEKKARHNKSFKPIQFIGIRYSKLDHLVRNIDPEIIKLQKQYQERILSDEDAAVLLLAKKKKERRNYVDIDYQPQLKKVTISVCKPQTYNLLKNIEPTLDMHSTKSSIRVFHQKEKLASRFGYSLKEFASLFHKLSQHGLIDPSQFDVLSPIFNRSPAITTQYSQVTEHSKRKKVIIPQKTTGRVGMSLANY